MKKSEPLRLVFHGPFVGEPGISCDIVVLCLLLVVINALLRSGRGLRGGLMGALPLRFCKVLFTCLSFPYLIYLYSIYIFTYIVYL